ncbi:MAG: hypothetical protein ACKOCT_19750 [Alphaproteobacteria bacterium]
MPLAFERRWRDDLLDAILPAPGGALPAMASVDRRSFWPRFERTAPLHLRAGFRLATAVLGGLAPRMLGHRGTLAGLDAEARDDVGRRAAHAPVLSELVLLAKLVACMAYFDDPAVQTAARGGAPRQPGADLGAHVATDAPAIAKATEAAANPADEAHQPRATSPRREPLP